ncbi:hypothetical protein QR680_016101 [Steinernema hermaphroditum]|uniref:Uncharacterized protein n=1 Tax=Steinernema hermaphroditum TaxID=289476 RepID=A0AA39HB46_9BILA|nr:hypothetical protein QR680_016101 [Steinernema hermaphroditum]
MLMKLILDEGSKMTERKCETEKLKPVKESEKSKDANEPEKRPRARFVRPKTIPAVLQGTIGPNGEMPPAGPAKEPARIFQAYRIPPRQYESVPRQFEKEIKRCPLDLSRLGPTEIPPNEQLTKYLVYQRTFYEKLRRYWDAYQ